LDNSDIFLAGIIGVPWQDISSAASQAPGQALEYIPVTDPAWGDVTTGGIWQQIYGDDDANITPGDVHMIESMAPRPGLAPASSGLMTDPENGHEYNTAREDLEYACVFPLQGSVQPRPCQCLSTATGNVDYACLYQHPNDCCNLSYAADGAGNPNSCANFDKPLCQNATGGYDTTQHYAKGYPGLRELVLLHDYAVGPSYGGVGTSNSIVASICPKDLSNSNHSDPGYGYNPAINALINRLKQKLKGTCLPRPLTANSDGSVPCEIVEAVQPGQIGSGTSCAAYCNANERGLPSPQMSSAVADAMIQARICNGDGSNGLVACSTMCICQLNQEGATDSSTNSGSNDLATCQSALDGDPNVASLPPGYCYIDPGNGIGNATLVAKCPPTERRILRYVGNNPTRNPPIVVPLPNAYVFTACQGSALQLK
jgi:hypothetical protein